MINIVDKKKCTGCMACYNSCPVNCIQMQEDNEGFWYPCVDKKNCINCGKCEKSCPFLENVIPASDFELCYAAYNKNDKERAISSSGGIFLALAKYVIDMGGIVYGAAYNCDMMVYHKKAENITELLDLVGSKYLQSRLDRVYGEIQKFLEDRRYVMFVGTACQIAGLRGFLKKEYDNLLTVDFICLGVPSPKVWKDYLETFFDKRNIKFVNFKDKTWGWHTFSLRIDDPEIKIRNGRETYYFAGYFKQLYSRPSCSECYFKGKNRVSDITISDCWGYEYIASEMDDNRGLSSIECHSDKGIQIFDSIKNKLEWKESNIEDVKKYNSNYCESAPMGRQRSRFWKDYDLLSKEELFNKYCKPEKETGLELIVKLIGSIPRKIKRKLRR